VKDEVVLTRADLVRLFTSPRSEERVGVESEYGVVDPVTGRSVPYEGPAGARSLLEEIAGEFGGTGRDDSGHLVAVQLPNGATFSLETGCALEYSSAPSTSLAHAAEAARTDIERAAIVADRFGLALLSGGLLPFTAAADVPWLPKPRVQIMLDYFAALGEPGSYAAGVMGLTLSTQTSLDYLSHQDLLEKLRLQVLAAPLVAALFVNSPIENGTETGALSRRMQFWRKFDPRRCGVLDFVLDPGSTAEDLVDWALGLPMIYRELGGTHVPAPPVPFIHVLQRGFGDGTRPTYADWILHLSQVWPHVRIRQTVETRASGALPWPYFSAAPALWVGLTYHQTARRRALDLLAPVTAGQLDRLTEDVALKGLAASVDWLSVRDLAGELLSLAAEGLSARVLAGKEPPQVLSYLEPLHDVVATSQTFADRCLTRWANDLGGDPGRYVQAFRVSARPGRFADGPPAPAAVLASPGRTLARPGSGGA
jgi:glutamate--cysteine ligase